MSSLVSYEDSDSDSEDEIKTVDRETSSSPSSSTVWTKNDPVAEMYPATSSSLYTTSKSTSHQNTPVHLLESQKRNTTLQPLLHVRTHDQSSNISKRQLPSSVRPYVPKRQRRAPVESSEPSEAPEHIQREERPILSEVSPTVKQCLSKKRPVVSGVPRRLLMNLGGHQGPVNTVKWCPVPHLSHLLLSASMDKTFKVWDGAESGHCLRLYTCHSEAVRAACWSTHGRHIFSGSFDNSAALTDVETGHPLVKLDAQFRVMCVAVHPSQPEVVLCGGYSPAVKAWDTRSAKVVREYRASVQQTLDVLFLKGGEELVSSTDCVSRDSADRTLIAWDYSTTARISNQIYHERYTCPSLALHPVEESFVAQTNGNYLALFSSQRPYRMNKRRRYEGHKVEGFAVQCSFSPDGTLLASGSSSGSAHFFDFHSGQMVHTLRAHNQACVSVSPHPVLPTTTATCAWDGEVKVWA
ncbi:WD repeat-containing protein 25 [Boleophthalmus pectinirostris]|uniref:WD repeat-containing protein 25 n=1 Tax=Boleophthalmus pectinirostris TaxID=150288 RepID=UPI000A1C3735|nr:WD repeat-containing protein 25 [Boleophthalmus pectinirostris]XP_055017045.1 WD repeat-containing protein 25 [Boleophthalmus pectinirostris]